MFGGGESGKVNVGGNNVCGFGNVKVEFWVFGRGGLAGFDGSVGDEEFGDLLG